MAPGFGGLFQTPFAAVFFSMEVIVTGVMAYEAFLPALIAAFMASMVSHALGLEKFQVIIKQSFEFSDTKSLLILITIGVIFGLVSIFLAMCLFVLWNGRYCGLGTNFISKTFTGGNIYAFDWIIKLFLTVLTLSIGFQGGEVTPLFSIGATLGFCMGDLFGISPVVCGALGYAAVFGSATNTVLAPFFIGMEVFGTQNAFAFLIVCSMAYIVNGNNCIYGAPGKREI